MCLWFEMFETGSKRGPFFFLVLGHPRDVNGMYFSDKPNGLGQLEQVYEIKETWSQLECYNKEEIKPLLVPWFHLFWPLWRQPNGNRKQSQVVDPETMKDWISTQLGISKKILVVRRKNSWKTNTNSLTPLEVLLSSWDSHQPYNSPLSSHGKCTRCIVHVCSCHLEIQDF